MRVSFKILTTARSQVHLSILEAVKHLYFTEKDGCAQARAVRINVY